MEPGGRVERYELVRLLGEGASSRVWLARDLEIGRLVALKLLERGAAEALQREAQLLARIDHPSIARLWTTGTWNGAPYIVLEYVDGQTLRSMLRRFALPIAEATRLVASIARALAVAHEAGICHGDVKPENVVLASDGAPRLIDLGLARRADDGADAANEITGTPGYLAPECWRGGVPTARADVFSLGVVWFECVSGERPWPGTSAELRGGETEALSRVLRPRFEGPFAGAERLLLRMLDIEPLARPSTAEVADALDRLLRRQTSSAAGERPFRGLEPYLEEHAHLFFGRDREIAEIRQRMLDHPLIAVVGPSGVGKSSLVMAGVGPQYEADGALPSLVLRPGAEPLRAAARQLLEHASVSLLSNVPESVRDDAAAGSQALADRLAADPTLFGRLLRERARAHDKRLLVIVDQSEELFTRTADPDVREAFARALASAADDVESPIRVVLALRDDFLGQAADLAPIARLLERGVFLLRPPSPTTLRDVIVRALAPFDYAFEEPALLEELVASVRDQTGMLPLVQFALERLWLARDEERRVLTRAAYDAIGGVAGALADHAQALLDAMSPAVSLGAQRLLLRLVTPEGTRASIAVDDLEGDLGPDARDAMRRLVDARLLQRRRDDDGHDIVELAHESLIGRWSTLRRWCEEHRADAELERFLRVAARRYRGSESPVDRLRGPSLDEALAWQRRRGGAVPAEVEALLAASLEGERRRAAFRRRLRLLAIGALAVIAVVSAGAAAIVRRQADRALASEEQATLALATSLLEAADAALAREDPREAVTRLRAGLEIKDSARGRALWHQLEREPLRENIRRDEMFYAAAFEPDGHRLATGGSAGILRLVDRMTGEETTIPTAHAVGILHLTFLDAGHVVTAGGDGRVVVWDLEKKTGKTIVEVPRTIAWRVARSPNGRLLAIAFANGAIWLHDLERHTATELGRHEGAAIAAAFLSDSEIVSGGRDDGVRIWDVGGRARPVDLPRAGATMLAAHAERGLVAIGRQDGSVEVWSPKTRERRSLRGHRRGVRSLAFSPDGKTLASGGWDGLRLWSIDTGETARVPGHTDAVYGLAFDGAGRLLASAATDRSVRVIDALAASAATTSRHTDRIHGIAISADGRLVASASADLTLRVWHTQSGVSRVLAAAPASISGVRFDPRSDALFVSGADGSVLQVDARTGETTDLQRKGSTSHAFAISPGGEAIAFEIDGALEVRARTPAGFPSAAGRRIPGHVDGVNGLAFDEGARHLASTEKSGQVRWWDLATGKDRLLGTHAGAGHGVAVHPRFPWVASGGADRKVRLWNVDHPERGHTLDADASNVWVVRFSADGATLAAIGDDAAATLWDVRDLERPPPRARVLGAGVGANELDISAGGLVAAGCDQETVRVFEIGGAPLWHAPAMLPSRPPCLAAPRPSPDDRAAASRAGLDRRLAERPPVCADTSADVCLREARGAVRTSPDGTKIALACGARTSVFAWPSLTPVADVPSTGDVFALTDGALAYAGADGRLEVRAFGAEPIVLVERGARLVAAGAGALGVVVDGALHVYEPDARTPRLQRSLGGADATALAFHDGDWAVGTSSGELLLVSENGPLRRLPAPGTSPVTRLVGEGRLLAAGQKSGLVALWSTAEERVLLREHLHGGAVDLRFDAAALHVTSDLGDTRRIDLAAFQRGWCAVLEDVVRRAPATWNRGHPARAGLPAGHACAPR